MDNLWKDMETGEIKSGHGEPMQNDHFHVNMQREGAEDKFHANQNWYCNSGNSAELLCERQDSDIWNAENTSNLQEPSKPQMTSNPHSSQRFTGTATTWIGPLSGSAPAAFPPAYQSLSSDCSSPSSSVSDTIDDASRIKEVQNNPDLLEPSLREPIFINLDNSDHIHTSASTSRIRKQQSILEKERLRKGRHNDIERRRRYMINNTIAELGALLPKSKDPNMKHNRGNILKRTVNYIKELKRDQDKIPGIETRITDLEIQNRLLLKIIGEKEKVLKQHGLNNEEEMSQESTKISSPETSQHALQVDLQSYQNSFNMTTQTVDNQGSYQNRNANIGMQELWRQCQNVTLSENSYTIPNCTRPSQYLPHQRHRGTNSQNDIMQPSYHEREEINLPNVMDPTQNQRNVFCLPHFHNGQL